MLVTRDGLEMAALGPFGSFHLFCVFSIFVYLHRLPPPPPKALINKRKLCKPVEMSEKEVANEKKEKEEEKKEVEKEEEEEEQDVAEKSSARTATRSSSGLVRTSFVKVWYRIRASNNIITHRGSRRDHLVIHHVKPPYLSITCPRDARPR